MSVLKRLQPVRFLPTSVAWSVSQLFAAGEQGALYDPSDLSTLFQDSAGTTPVTAVEQPVGRMLDKSGRGNHATQSTTTKRPVLSRRVVLNLKSEYPGGVADAVTRGGLVTSASIPGFLGGTAIAFGHNGVTSSYAYRNDFSPTLGMSYELSVFVKMDDGEVPQFVGNHSDGSNVFAFVLAGTPVIPSTNPYAVSPTAVPGIYRVSVTTLAQSNVTNCGIVKYATNSNRTFRITGFNARLATDAHLPYQWVNTATDYDADPSKFPAYLRFDGVDDALQTGNIDFTSTDKMTVWAGVTRLSDAAVGVVSELSSNVVLNTGVFGLFVPADSSPVLQFVSGGTITAGASKVTSAAPETRVLTGYANIAGQVCGLRGEGFVVTSSATQGVGNYGNHPMYICARAGTSRYFNGRLYSLIVRGAQTGGATVEAVERYIKSKVRIP